jgi:hypothetical protein
MSSLIINIRFGCYHFQVDRNKTRREGEKRFRRVRWTFNGFHKGNPKKFEVYKFIF